MTRWLSLMLLLALCACGQPKPLHSAWHGEAGWAASDAPRDGVYVAAHGVLTRVTPPPFGGCRLAPRDWECDDMVFGINAHQWAINRIDGKRAHFSVCMMDRDRADKSDCYAVTL